MHLDPVLPAIGAVVGAMLVSGFVARRLGQPFAIGCVVAGVALGPSCAAVLADADLVAQLGSVGVVLLLFFVGLEVSPPKLFGAWKVAVIGTAVQIAASVGCMAVVGELLDWPIERTVLLGFVISISSTAVVLRLLPRLGESDTPVGTDVVAVLLAQDIAIVPMILTIGWMSGGSEQSQPWAAQLGVAVLVIGCVIWALRRGRVSMPIERLTGGDHELEVVASLVPCVGLALLTGVAGLSSGLGAFAGGILMALTPAAHRIAKHLKSFEVIFVGIFFVSVGMILDLDFLAAEWPLVTLAVVLVLVTNTLINAATLRLLGRPWRRAFYGGALLAQVGEFSFVLAALGRSSGVIGEFSYQLAISVIIITLVLSPPWVAIFRRFAVQAGGGAVPEPTA